MIEVGCPAHILNYFIHHGAVGIGIDIENTIKIYQYFFIYVVRTEPLKGCCEFADVDFRLLSESTTRWLSLFPGITRLIKMLLPVKFFFLSQEYPPTIIKQSFGNEMSEIYLWHMHSLAFFHTHIQTVERVDNSFVEVLTSLESIRKIIEERKNQNFKFF